MKLSFRNASIFSNPTFLNYNLDSVYSVHDVVHCIYVIRVDRCVSVEISRMKHDDSERVHTNDPAPRAHTPAYIPLAMSMSMEDYGSVLALDLAHSSVMYALLLQALANYQNPCHSKISSR